MIEDGEVIIVETPIFTRHVTRLLDEEEYRLIQLYLADRPDAGAVLRGSGGLRKLRWSRRGIGKRGGVRTIYYWAVEVDTLLMLTIYTKAAKSGLTTEQRAILRAVVEREFR